MQGSKGRVHLPIWGLGVIDQGLNVEADKFSLSARQKIEAAGGKVEEVGAAKAT